MDAIPIERLVEEAKRDFVNWITKLAMAAILKAAPWLAWVAAVIESIVSMIVTWLVGKGELGLFVLNTKVLTSDQAKDYRAAVAKRLQAPGNINNDEWERLEDEVNHKFIELVRFAR